LKFIRIVAALVLPLVWLVWIAYKVVSRDSADHILGLANAVALFVAPAQWIAPPDYARSKLFLGAGALVFATWAVCFWRFASGGAHRIALLIIGGLLALSAAVWLIDKGYRRWAVIKDPVTRLFIATAAITVTVVTSAIGGICALTWASQSFASGNTSAGWLIALLLNIPLFALIAVERHQRRTRSLKHDE